MIGQTFAHFRIVAKLGEGGMGAVYLAKDTRLKREVALKILPEGLSQDSERLARFQREAETLAALNHPNIVAIYSVEQAGAQRCLIMERVVGRSLGEEIPEGGFEPEAFYDLALPIADAMAAAHARGIVHRDIKPANVMVSEDGIAKVLDLGLAKLLESSDDIDDDAPTQTASPTALGAVMGTAGYMSPEQAEGKPVGPQSDVFSLGALFYEMLTGVNPFRRDSVASSIAAILHDVPEELRKLHPGLPPDLQRILDRCLAKDPERRYSSAENLGIALRASRDKYLSRHTGLGPLLRRPAVMVPALLLVTAGIVGLFIYRRGAAEREWARTVALPEIERLIEASFGDHTDAYELAVEAERAIPNDPHLRELIARCSRQVRVTSEPAGAEVSVRRYDSPEDEWTSIGITPIEGVRLPVGVMRWRFEKAGYEPTTAVATTWAITGGTELLSANHVDRTLDREDSTPAGMLRVAGFESPVGPLGDFYIDRYEVTNRQFKEFVDAGGYRRPELWKHPLEDEGTPLSFEEAMSLLVDRTARPGPATWTAGTYPEGEGDHPVGGVSWYEAAAYAEFAGKALPTVHHWGRARGEGEMLIEFPQLGGYRSFAPYSNFDGRGAVAVGSLEGATSFGAHDMAGNVREWCFNSTPLGAVVRGGAWSDATYMSEFPSQLPLMDRSPQNGFRCAHYPDSDGIPGDAGAPIEPSIPKMANDVDPVSDEIFAVYRERFAYDRTALDARLESRSDEPEHWTRESVSFNAAYGGERLVGHLFLPRNATPPYQTVIYFPGSGSIIQGSSTDIDAYWEVPLFLSFLMQSGRAVLYPVYKGTFERQDPTLFAMHQGDGARRYTDYVTQLVRDVSRSIDFLESRDDIDVDRVAYYGMSWGANMGALVTAIEERFKASVLLSGGLAVSWGEADVAHRPEANPIIYAPRVRIPTLMINGRYDTILPLEVSIRPLYESLGVPESDKELKLYDADHVPPRNEYIKEILAWLDRYLGPVP